jgi:hypothetical protein
MGKTKQSRAVEQAQEQNTPVPMAMYKPIPKFKTGCKNC